MTKADLQQERAALVARMHALNDNARDEHRKLTDAERGAWDTLDLAQGKIAERLAREYPEFRGATIYAGRDGLAAIEEELAKTPDDALRPPPYSPRHVPGEVRMLAPNERIADYVTDDLPDGIRRHEVNLGRAIRAMATGDWSRARTEQRAMGSYGVQGYMIPDSLSAEVIDLARARTRVIQAGARTILMPTAEVALARVAGDPTAGWKGENQPATVSDVELEKITLRSRTLVAVVKASVELMEDAKNFSQVVEQSLAAALALELDRAALRGGQTAGPIEPTGVRWTSGVQLLDVAGQLGSGSGVYDWFSRAYTAIQNVNGPEDGVSIILHPRELGRIDRTLDGEGNPTRPPESWTKMRKFSTTQIPTTLGAGTASEAYVAPWSELLIGMRTSLTIEASRVAADGDGSAFRNLQVWIRAYLRGDVAPAREQMFVALHGILPTP